MNLINNRYRVIRNLKQSRIQSSYLVTDIMKNHETLELHLLNAEYIPEVLLNYYIEDFISLISLQYSNIVRVFDFGLVSVVDNKRLTNKQYFYTHEHLDNRRELLSAMGNMTWEERVEAYVLVCQAVNYLHLNGIIHGSINAENIFINENNNLSEIKLKDLATVALEKHNYIFDNMEQISYKAPETLKGEGESTSTDVYSLGMLLFKLFSCKECSNELQCPQFLDDERRTKVNELASLMTELSQEKRIKYISEVIKELNLIFNTNYLPVKKDEREKLSFNIKLIGRVDELKEIMKSYAALKEYKNREKIICFHGDTGIGKTRLLKEADHLLYLRKANVYSSFILDNSKEISNKAIIDILKKIIADCPEEILQRHEKELVKIIPELGEIKNVDFYNFQETDREKYRLISRILAFIDEFVKNQPVVFILDNVHYIDDFSLEILKLLFEKSKASNNMLFIMSYNNSKGANPKVIEAINKAKNIVNILDMELTGLNLDETGAMIQSILHLKDTPVNFASKIYEKTYGHPLFIEETIKDLVLRKILYVDEKTGKWNTKYENYDELPMPPNMQAALVNQLGGIDVSSREILKGVSIFNTGVSIEVLKGFYSGTEDIGTLLESMVNRGILCKKIEDMGFVYDFYNKILKNYIYSELEDKDKKSKHELAAFLLERQYEDEGRENKDELIYHLEKSSKREELIKYCLDNADKMLKLKIKDEAVNSLLKALSMFEENSNDHRQAELLSRIANIFYEEGNMSTATQYYERALDLAQMHKNSLKQIDILLEMANLYYNKNNVEKTLELLEITEEILKNIHYIKGYLECNRLMAAVYSLQRNYDKSYEVCLRCLPLCTEDYIKHRGFFYNLLGNIYFGTSRMEQALQNFEESRKCFERINYLPGIVTALNNIGATYSDFYQNTEKGIEYFTRMKDISEANNLLSSVILGLTNLAGIYFDTFDYELSLQYFKEALESAKRIEYESNVFYNYNYLSLVNLRLANYKEAIEYHKLAQKELEEYPEHGIEIAVYYMAGAELYFALGDKEKAKELIIMSLSYYEEDYENAQKLSCEALKCFIELSTLDHEEDYPVLKEKLLTIKNRYMQYDSRMSILIEACMILLNRGYRELAVELYNSDSDFNVEELPEALMMKGLYLKGIIEESEDKLKCLNDALEGAKKHRNKYLQCKICDTLGDYYFNAKNYFYAINYYFEASEAVKGLCNQIPRNYRIDFVKSHDLLRAPIKLWALKNNENYNKIQEIWQKELEIVTPEDIDRLFDFHAFKEILNNRFFLKSARRIYKSVLPDGIFSLEDIIENLSEDSQENLNSICKFISSFSFATKALIISEEDCKVIASSDGTTEIENIKHILEKTKQTKEPIFVSEDYSRNVLDSNMMPENIKALICMPITMKKFNYSNRNKDGRLKHKSTKHTSNIKGYLYLESERTLHNFNNKTFGRCSRLISLLGFIIEKYQLKITSSIDKLTEVLTRKALEEALAEQLDKSNNDGQVFSLIMFDLDHFKVINDKFGHQTGDNVLKEVCRVVRENIRLEDSCGRYGGEEFIIILPNVDSLEALKIADRLRIAIEGKKILGEKYPVTVSMGLSTYPSQGQWQQELVEKADQALYVAKARGRNLCQLWNQEFSGSVKVNNKLSGIVTGNVVQDSRNVLVMLELLELLKSDKYVLEKIYELLGRIVEITEAQSALLFMIKDNNVTDIYGRKALEQQWIEVKKYNKNLIQNVIKNRQGTYLIDWDDISGYDVITSTPDWHSVILVPLIRNGELVGILYLTSSVRNKEFRFDDYNFVSTLGSIVASII